MLQEAAARSPLRFFLDYGVCERAESHRMRPTAIDLFSGCGGLTLGLKRGGFKVLGAVELDELAADTYERNHPEVHLWRDDIRSITAPQVLTSLKLKRGELDLLAACPPCQGFSAIRRLNGGRRIRDSQNDLIFDFLRLVKGLKPKAILLENVPGLAVNYRFAKLRTALRKLGYFLTVAVQDARHYGVPQRRRRLILLGALGIKVDLPTPARRTRTVREAFALLTVRKAKKDALHNLPESRSARVKALIRLIPKNGGSRLDLGTNQQLRCHRDCDGFKDVYGRMKWDDVAPTITGGCCNPSKGRFLHPAKHRNISLREAALLQSFPPNYYFSLQRGKFAAAQMIGNALPPEFVRHHAKQVAGALGRRRNVTGSFHANSRKTPP